MQQLCTKTNVFKSSAYYYATIKVSSLAASEEPRGEKGMKSGHPETSLFGRFAFPMESRCLCTEKPPALHWKAERGLNLPIFSWSCHKLGVKGFHRAFLQVNEDIGRVAIGYDDLDAGIGHIVGGLSL